MSALASAGRIIQEEPLPEPGASVLVKIGVRFDRITGTDQRAENFTAVISAMIRYRDPALGYSPKVGEPGFRMYRLESLLKLIEERGRPDGPRKLFRCYLRDSVQLASDP